MNYIFFDTETTGLGNKDEIIQISGIVTDLSLNIKEVFSEYVYTDRPITPGALQVHGIDSFKLRKLSSDPKTGMPLYLEDKLGKIQRMFSKGNIFVGHNVNFDIRLLQQSLALSIKKFSTPDTFEGFDKCDEGCNYKICTLTQLKKYGPGKGNKNYSNKLEKYIERFNSIYGDNAVENSYVNFCSKFNVSSEKGKSHDSLFDTFATYLLFAQYQDIMFL